LEEIATILAALFRNHYLNPNTRPGVFCEVMATPSLDAQTVVRHCHDTLQKAWKRALQLLAPKL